MKKNIRFVLVSILLVLILMIFLFNQLDKILYIPEITPEEWCKSQPCVELNIFSLKIILVQPSSTFLVYLLGFITITIGIYLLKIKNKQNFITWWGIALLFWGIGAIVAGTSYQAFSYEIKCAGRGFCIWTSMWEIIYLLLSVGSVNAMLVAQANLNKKDQLSRIMIKYAIANFFVYEIILAIGAIVPVQFMISFEMMIIILTPTILSLLIFNVQRYFNEKKRINLSLVIIWISLILIKGLYFLYFMMDITHILWEKGLWFSENDILHIGLILWMIYIGIVINRFGKKIELK